VSTATKVVRAISFLFAYGCLFSTAFGHDPGLSSASLRVSGETVTARLIFARADIERLIPLDADDDGTVMPEEFQSARTKLETLATNALKLAMDNQPLSAKTSVVQIEIGDGVCFDLSYIARGTRLSVSSELISSLARGHRQYLTVHDEQNRPLSERMLDATHYRFELKLPASAAKPETAHPFRQFVNLGVEHIVTGYDHLAFLLGLLLVGGSFRSALKIITSFTLAHSLTLALATFNLIRLSPTIVEPLITASIIYVGVENILRSTMDKRWLLTFGFGLIHGCGFASALKEAGVGADGGGIALPLFSFNLGVEFGQVAIAALVLPLIWKFRSRPVFIARWAPTCSAVVVLLGGFWFVQRVWMNL